MRIRKRNIRLFIVILFVAVIFVAGSLIAKGRPDEIYDEAVRLFNEESYEEACEKIKTAIEKNGDKADYYIVYGMALIGCADYENAREQFLHVVQNKNHKISKENNKHAYRGIALTYYESGIYDQAKAYFQLALETEVLEEMDSDLTAYVAECEIFLGEYSDAIKSFTKLIEGKTAGKEEEAGYYIGRANAYMITGEYMKAATDYEQAIKKNKKSYPAYIGKYLALVNTHDENSANEFLQESIEVLKKNENENYYLAILEYYNNNDEVAMELFAAEKEAGNKEADYYIGLIKQRKGLYEEALLCYEEYITVVPSGKTAEYCNQVGGCYMSLEKYENAVKCFDEGMLIAGGNLKQEIMRNCIIAYEKCGNYKQAEKYAAEYIETYDDPDMVKEYKFIQTRITEKENE